MGIFVPPHLKNGGNIQLFRFTKYKSFFSNCNLYVIVKSQKTEKKNRGQAVLSFLFHCKVCTIVYIRINISASREGCPAVRTDVDHCSDPAFRGIFFLAQSLFCAQHEVLIRTEFWLNQTIHFKSARKNWQRKRKKRKKNSVSWRSRAFLPEKRRPFSLRKINPDLSGLFLTENKIFYATGSFLVAFIIRTRL